MLSVAGRRRHAQPMGQNKAIRFSEPKKVKDKEKKYVSTSGLFKSDANRGRKTTKVSKSAKKTDLGKKILKSRRHPSSSPLPRKLSLATVSNDILNDYRAQVTNTSEEALSNTYKLLVHRLDPQNLPSDALPIRIRQAAETAATFAVPLAEESIKVHYRDRDGNITTSEHIAIGQTVGRFQNKFSEKKLELEALWEEWDQLQQQIAGVGAQILRDAEFPVRFGFEPAILRPDPSSPLDQDIQDLRRTIDKAASKTRKEAEQEAEDTRKAHRKERSALAAYLEKMNDE